MVARTRTKAASALACVITAALACGGGSGDTEDTEGGGPSGVGLTSTSTDGTAGTSSDTGASTGMGTDASGSGSDGTSGSGSAGSTGVKFDIGMESTSGSTSDTEGEGEGCKKVDLLFVIDNSGSMEDEQVNLINSFPGFINQIQTQLADTEGYHVGITTTDAYIYNTAPCTTPGALVTRTGGTNASQMTCGPYFDGFSYMTESDDLATAFSCAGKVGTGGDGDETPMQTMQLALSDALNAPGACNAGFLRDDALLVIVVITDEEDDHEVDACLQNPQQGSPGEPPGWYAGVVAAKGGIESNIVVLSLVGPPGPDPAVCPPLDKCSGGIIGAEVTTRIVQFTQMFTNGFVGRVCEASYDGFFSQAVGVIQSACEGFMPPE